MKKCPFRAHMQRVEAAQAGGVTASSAVNTRTGQAASEYELMRAALGNDLRQLHNTQSLERKIEAKRGMIERYRDWIDGALAAAKPANDEIVTTILVWSIDIGEWALALTLARHVIAHGLPLPERYKRTPATLIAEEFAEAGIAAEATIDLATLLQVEALTEGADMPDEVRAKVKKSIGLAFKAKANAFDPTAESGVAGGKPALIAAALSHLVRAVALDGRCGVKQIIKQLEAEAKRLASERPE
jgi:hypothetical protein